LKLAFIKKRFSVHGGAEKYLQTLLAYLKKSENEIHIFSNEWAEEEGIIFHKVRLWAPFSFLSAIIFNYNVQKELYDGIHPDVTISFERTTCQDIYRAGDGCHKEWLQLRRSVDSRWKQITFAINPLHRVLLALERKLFHETKLIIANSHMVKKQIIHHYGLPEIKINVIYNGVDLRRFTPLNREKWRGATRKELSIPDAAKVLLFVGSGYERKGLGTVLRALSVLKQKGDLTGQDMRLLVVGKGDMKKFTSLAIEKGIYKDVVFLGSQANVEKFYAAADLFVLPTLYDPFSNATIEAMASGLPVITTANNGTSEIVEEGVEGFLLRDALDYNDLAEKIRKTFARNAKMGEHARQKAEKYPIETAVKKFIAVLYTFWENNEKFVSS
jgi:UDP-glucose:(heptosyl)LPS alpha-1,3-glucosyltransferase